MGETGRGEGMAGDGAFVGAETRFLAESFRDVRPRTDPESRGSPMRNCGSEVRSFHSRPGMTNRSHARQPCAEKHSPNAGNPAKLQKVTLRGRLPLTSGVWSLCSAQPLGSPSYEMRNIITKILIVVVPRRTAGDG